MKRQKCAIAATLSEVGEPWNLLILREVFWGYHRFSDFHKNLGLAKNLLSERLKKLCDYDILKQLPMKPGSKRMEYHLTAKGYDLYPVLLTLMQWGNKWLFSEENIPFHVIDKERNPVLKLKPFNTSGTAISFASLELAAGPGADEMVKQRLKHLNKTDEQQ